MTPKIVIAISSFRSDPQVLQLVEELYRGDYAFDAVVVVCSAGGSELSAMLRSAGYRNCHVLPFDANLGSAGNLYQRFKASAALGGDFMLALNQDAALDPAMFGTLFHAARTLPGRVGALYPLRYTPGKQQYDLSGVAPFPFRFRGEATVTEAGLIDVVWSSSNGALYALAPFREGIHTDAGLWMGWEDYLYGLQLRRAGFRQYIVADARIIDDYEYKTIDLIGLKLTVSDKPSWYCYYGPRNLALISLHRCFSPRMVFDLMRWAISFPAQIVLSRTGTDRWRALGYFLIGLAHGLFNKSGKWRLP